MRLDGEVALAICPLLDPLQFLGGIGRGENLDGFLEVRGETEIGSELVPIFLGTFRGVGDGEVLHGASLFSVSWRCRRGEHLCAARFGPRR